jgi:hypothetical protein
LDTLVRQPDVLTMRHGAPNPNPNSNPKVKRECIVNSSHCLS